MSETLKEIAEEARILEEKITILEDKYKELEASNRFGDATLEFIKKEIARESARLIKEFLAIK